MDTYGAHILADLWLHGPLPAGWQRMIRAALDGPGKMEVLDVICHKFEPQGESWVWLLAESHCAAHTYPEHHYISLDIYGCGQGEPALAMRNITMALAPRHMDIQTIQRGRDAGAKTNAA